MSIGEYLRSIRLKKGISQRQLSALCGISNSEISRIEAGERVSPSPGVLRAIAIGLGVPYEEVLTAAGYLQQDDEIRDDGHLRDGRAGANRLPEWVYSLPPDLYDFVKEDASQGWTYTRLAKGLSRKDLDPKELEALVRTWVQAKRGKRE
ncbi:MAG: helix-turn-helix domain-containing protein [Bacillota bacterium]